MADHTALIVTADHGFAWQVGVETRRRVRPSNVEELTPVPLFLRRTGPASRPRGEPLAQTLDVAPTIADLLGVRLGYRADGRSAFSAAVARRREVALTTRDFSATVRISAGAWIARRRAVVSSPAAPARIGGWASLFTGIGPHRDLIGRARPTWPARPRSGPARASRSRRHSPTCGAASGVVPAEIAGSVRERPGRAA